LPTTTDPYLSGYNGRFIGPVKNRPLELPDGRLLCGSSTENNGWQVHMEIAGTTNNYTTNYQLTRVTGGSAIQPTFLVHDDNYQTIQAICRPNVTGSGLAMNTWSRDGGSTWTNLSTFPLTVEGGLHALTINNLNSAKRRWHVLAYNASSTRDPLKIAISQDGTNWTVAIPSLDSGNKMDYPTLMQSSDKLLHVVYSYYGHTKIKHVVLDPYVLLNEPRP
jgi:predicted neuraminidase